MARNRRHQSAAIRFGPALKAVALCLVIGGSAVGYVWQKDQIRRLEERIARTESELEQWRGRNAKLRIHLNTLQSTANLESLARQLNLGLRPSSPSQMIRMPEPMRLESLPVAGESTVQYAGRQEEWAWSR